MSDEITPALTPEEWAELADGYIWILQENGLSATLYGDGRLMLTTPTDSDALAERRHALAALCLVGQPFGFTHDDADLCRSVASEIVLGLKDLQVRIGDPLRDEEQDSSCDLLALRLRSLASRIASLLPPPSPGPTT